MTNVILGPNLAERLETPDEDSLDDLRQAQAARLTAWEYRALPIVTMDCINSDLTLSHELHAFDADILRSACLIARDGRQP
ncbi:MAG: hypothetical protein ABGZ17_26770 [Planctomycetaceae bacterium]